MSVDLLQEKIRKCKNPTMVELAMDEELIPQAYLQGSIPGGWEAYCRELLDALKETVPAVRLGLGCSVIYGAEGVRAVENIASYAKELGYYVVMDAPELLSAAAAFNIAAFWPNCDALVVSPWLGSDILKPLTANCQNGKALFTVVRSGNKSASELQDLLTGSRHVHVAAMDLVTRHGESLIGKYGYSQMGAQVGATAANAIKNLRAKYPKVFLLVNGIDLAHGNFKNGSYAFDKFGRGAIACAGADIMAAWAEENAPEDPMEAAVQAANRIRKNLTRYVTVL